MALIKSCNFNRTQLFLVLSYAVGLIIVIGADMTFLNDEMTMVHKISDSFCSHRRPQHCCKGRNDNCTMPILDTGIVCYCDEFCNRTNADCCPDFWSYCMGIEPPAEITWAAVPKFDVYVETEEIREELLSMRFCTAINSHQCCAGRSDGCEMSLYDTYCYCDSFCNRTDGHDCCPDYWENCLGTPPPEGPLLTPGKPNMTHELENNCYHEGQLYSKGDVITVNCNNCTCSSAEPMKPEYNWKCSQKICLMRGELIDYINEGHFGWEATNYSFFWSFTLNEGIMYRLGTIRPTETVKQMSHLNVHISDILPEDFDGRDEWPGILHEPMDQGNCGSSWAFSTTGVAADRLALHSQGGLSVMLSPQQLLSCNTDHMQKGCRGGHLDRAWWYLRQYGVVSDDCYPYTSGATDFVGPCMVPKTKSLAGRARCPNEDKGMSHMFGVAPPYRIAPSEREIMKEIMDNGPVQATIEVKEDFYMYRGGVYRYTMPAKTLPPNHINTGFHSVKMLGWGTDNSTGKPLKYWLCANSWGTEWGEGGYFKIVRGMDECKVESFVIAAWAQIRGHQMSYREKRHLRETHLNNETIIKNPYDLEETQTSMEENLNNGNHQEESPQPNTV